MLVGGDEGETEGEIEEDGERLGEILGLAEDEGLREGEFDGLLEDDWPVLGEIEEDGERLGEILGLAEDEGLREGEFDGLLEDDSAAGAIAMADKTTVPVFPFVSVLVIVVEPVGNASAQVGTIPL